MNAKPGDAVGCRESKLRPLRLWQAEAFLYGAMIPMKLSKSLIAAGAVLAFALVLSPRLVAGAKAESKTAAAPADAPPGTVTVKGKDFAFTVHSPEGWQGDTEAAKKYQGNVLFTPKAATAAASTLILVSADHKFDENVALRMQSTIDSYRQKYPQLQLGDLDVKHPQYATYAKLLFQPGAFYQYVAYLNPGSLQPYSLYVALLKRKDAATPAEIAAFKEILESLRMAPPAVRPE